jgi:hypothetical protein
LFVSGNQRFEKILVGLKDEIESSRSEKDVDEKGVKQNVHAKYGD